MPELSSQDTYNKVYQRAVQVRKIISRFRFCLLFSSISIITLVEYHILSVNVLFLILSTNLVYYNLLITFYKNIFISNIKQITIKWKIQPAAIWKKLQMKPVKI